MQNQEGKIIILCTLALYRHTNGTVLTGTSYTVWFFLSSCQLANGSQMFVLKEREKWPYPLAQIITVIIITSYSYIAGWVCLSQTLCSIFANLKHSVIPHNTSENDAADCLISRKMERGGPIWYEFVISFLPHDSSLFLHSSCSSENESSC